MGWRRVSEIVQQYPGLKLANDLCPKYHNGQKAAERGGYTYMYGAKEGMIGADVIKKTLERTGYDGLNGKELRSTLFGLTNIDTGGLFPTYDPDPNVLMTWPVGCLVKINDQGYYEFDHTQDPWFSFTGVKVYPGLKITVTPEWKDWVWFPPSM